MASSWRAARSSRRSTTAARPSSGSSRRCPTPRRSALLETLTDTFIPGRVAELRPSNRKELAATLALRMPIGEDNWSLKVSAGWPEDPDEDVAGDAWAGVVPMQVTYGVPEPAPDLAEGIPLPDSVRALTGPMRNTPPSVQ